MRSPRSSILFQNCLLVWAVVGVWVAEGPAWSQEAGGKPSPDRTIYVPFKNLQEILEKRGESALVPYEDYLRYLREVGKLIEEKLPAEAVITAARYVGTIEGDVARIRATYTVQVLGKPWVELPLEFGEAAVGQVQGGEKVLLRGTGEGTYALLLGAEGEQTVTLELLARVRSTPEGREFSLTAPPVGLTTFELTVPEGEQTIELTPRLVIQGAEGGADATTVRATLGATRKITARWHPRTSLKPEMELLSSASNRQLVTIEGGYVHHDAWLTYEVLRGQLSGVRVAAPLGARILDVTADVGVKRWEAQGEGGRQVIAVEFLAPVEKQVTVEVHTERPLGDAAEPVVGLDADGAAHGLHALDVVRESGQVAVRVAEALELTVEEQQGVARIATEEVDPRLKPGAATAFRFYTPQLRLVVRARPVEPRVLAMHATRLVFEEDELRLQAELTYQIERAGVFEVRLRVPENLVIDDVQSPLRQEDSLDAAARILTVKLQQATMGQFTLVVRGHQPFETGRAPVEQDLPLLEPLGVMRETGTVSVWAPPGIEVVTNAAAVQSAQPAPVPPGTQADGTVELRSTWSYTRRPVRIPVTTTRRPTRLSAAAATTIDVQPETIEVTTWLDYRVEFAGIDTVRLWVPEAVSAGVQIEAEATGPESAEIQQKSAGAAENGWAPWTVVWQRKVVGTQRLRVQYRLTPQALAAPPDAAAPAAGAAQPITLFLIRPDGKPATSDGAEAIPLTRLQGEVRVLKDPTLSVTVEAAGGDVEPIDLRELTLLPPEGALAFRYYRQPQEGGIEVRVTRRRPEVLEVTPTVVEKGLVEIATARHTAATFRCRYLVKTVERQRLRIDLPKDLEVLGVFVDGSEEKLQALEAAEAGPAQEDVTAYAVNIGRRGRSEEPFVLTLQFNWNVNPPPFEATFGRGEIQFPLPRIGVRRVAGGLVSAPVQQLRTIVYVPRPFWLVGTPEQFQILGEYAWSDLLRVAPFASPAEASYDFPEAPTVPLDFPTEGLRAVHYQNLGGAPRITVAWWDVAKMTTLLSVAWGLIAFILLRTTWENKLNILLIAAFLTLLFGVKDRDAVLHGVAAARWGLAFLLALWIVQGLFSWRPRSTPAVTEASASAPPPPPPAEEGRDSLPLSHS